MKEKYEESKISSLIERSKKNYISINSVFNFFLIIILLGLTISLGVIYNEGVQLVAEGKILIGNIIQVFQLSIQIITAFFGIGVLGGLIVIFRQSYKKIEEIMTLEEIERVGSERIDGLSNKKIDFKNVNFSIDDTNVLNDVSFSILPGKINAIIGTNGCGKSIIASLLMKSMEPTSGSIMVQNIPLNTIDIESYKKYVSIVMQDNNIFSGTIERNFRLVNDKASKEKEIQVIQDAAMDDFALNNNEISNLNIVNGGINISGGQKQRIAIANALIKDADLFIFDNIFSSLDTITIKRIKEALASNYLNKTILLLSQRVSDVKDADNIIVMDNGTVIAQGSHQYLKENNKIYQDFINSQIKEGI